MAIDSERKASAEALRNYDCGVASYQSIDMVEQANDLRVAASKTSTGNADNGMALQKAIIDKFNIQQAVKWRKVLQAELESLVTDRGLLDYSIAKNQINSAFMIVSLVVINITQYAYAVPLVSNTVEDGYGQ